MAKSWKYTKPKAHRPNYSIKLDFYIFELYNEDIMHLNSFIASGLLLLLGHNNVPDIRVQTCNEFLQALDKKDTLSYNEIDLEAQCVDTLKRYTDFKKPLYTQSQNTLKKYPI